MFNLDFVHEQRIPEWATSGIMILGAVQVLWLSDINLAEGYDLFIWAGIPKIYVIYFLGIVGIARIIALFINGKWKRTPLIRGTGAIIGCALFAAMSVSLYLPVMILAVLDFRAIILAGRDSKRAKKNVGKHDKSSFGV